MSAITPTLSQAASPHATEDENTLSHVPGRREKVASEIAQKQLNQSASSQAGSLSERWDTYKQTSGFEKRLKPNGVPRAVLEKLQNLEAQRVRYQEYPNLTREDVRKLGCVLNEIDTLRSQYYMISEAERKKSLKEIETLLHVYLSLEGEDSGLLSLLSENLRKQSLLLYKPEGKKKLVDALGKIKRSLKINPQSTVAINISGKIYACFFLYFSTGKERKLSGILAEKSLKQTLGLNDMESIELLGKVLTLKSEDLVDKEEKDGHLKEMFEVYKNALGKQVGNLHLFSLFAFFSVMSYVPILKGEAYKLSLEQWKEGLGLIEMGLRDKITECPGNFHFLEDYLQVIFTQIYWNFCSKNEMDEKFNQMRVLLERYQKENAEHFVVKVCWARFFFLQSRFLKEEGKAKELLEKAASTINNILYLVPERFDMWMELLLYMTELVGVLKGPDKVKKLDESLNLLQKMIAENPENMWLRLQLGEVLSFRLNM
ncbi:MAG: hypothetical protein WAM28_01810 [Chlamydiales bacterium]